MFTANGHPQKGGCHVLLQYLQHSTHSPEKDIIWDEERKVATLVGNLKLASLHMSPDSRYIARAASWRAEGPVLQQLRIYDCTWCNKSGEHQCGGQCCAIPCARNKFVDVGNRYVELAQVTCKKGIADKTTCDGSNCQQVERLLPGVYIWFGHAHAINWLDLMYGGETHKMEPLDENDFKRNWDRKSQYGNQSLVSHIHNLLTAYGRQIPKGRKVVFRCGGTLLYQQEICYVTIVTFENDGYHDILPTVNSPAADNPQCDWSGLLDENGRYRHVRDQYPTFVPCSDTNLMVFAFHLPNGMTLSLHSEELVGGEPLQTEHDWCHRYRYMKDQSATRCMAEEESYAYHQWIKEQVSPWVLIL